MALNYTTEKLAEIANSTSPIGFMQGVNTSLMNGWYGSLILIAAGAIMFIAFIQSNNDVKKSASATLMLCFVLSLLLRAMLLIPNEVVTICLVGAALAIAFAFRE